MKRKVKREEEEEEKAKMQHYKDTFIDLMGGTMGKSVCVLKSSLQTSLLISFNPIHAFPCHASL